MTYDDFIFYLPAFGSLALVGISAVLGFVFWRVYAEWKKKRAVEKSKKT